MPQATLSGRQRILDHLAGKPVDRLPFMPITMMFAADQAGRKYLDYARDHRVLVEGQLRTAERFDVDFVSVISDPGREAADLGAEIEYFPDQPPAIKEDAALLADKAVLAGLKPADPLGGGRMHDRVRGVALLREKVGKDKLVEGWIEGPCAEAADLRGLNPLMLDFFDDPAFVRDLFELCVANALTFARAQVDAGADLIGVGDAAASLVGPEIYHEFVWPLEKKLIDGLKAMGAKTRLHICGNTAAIAEGMGRLGFDIVDLDYLCPVAHGRQAMGPGQMILGNLDPVRALRNSTPTAIEEEVRRCHQAAGPRFIVSAGCEVPRDTSADNFRAMLRYARWHGTG